VVEDKQASSDSEAFHFISYVPYRGNLYELDGLQKGPIDLGPCTKENWLEKVRPEIQKRMDQYATEEIRFNLMGLIQSRQDMYTTELVTWQSQQEELQAQIAKGGADGEAAAAKLPQVMAEIERLNGQIAQEVDKVQNWKLENMRRKHNYVPFLLKFLKILAEKGQLSGLVEKARAS